MAKMQPRDLSGKVLWACPTGMRSMVDPRYAEEIISLGWPVNIFVSLQVEGKRQRERVF